MDPKSLVSVGPYQLTKVLGKGADSVVRLGIHTITGEHVAVKIIDKSRVEKSPKLFQRIEREVAVLRRLNHPNILKFVDYFDAPKYSAIVMEYISGGDLCAYLHEKCKVRSSYRRGLASMDAFNVFYQILNAVEYCHINNIVHRDLKPDNILIDQTNPLHPRFVIADFGLCREMHPMSDLMKTRCGSPMYAAPEVIRGEEYSGTAADVWSLGVVLFTLCAGRLPFYHENTSMLFKLICQGRYAIPSHFGSSLHDLIRGMLDPLYQCRTTLAEIKRHTWWIENCHRYGFAPFSPISSYPSTTAVLSPGQKSIAGSHDLDHFASIGSPLSMESTHSTTVSVGGNSPVLRAIPRQADFTVLSDGSGYQCSVTGEAGSSPQVATPNNLSGDGGALSETRTRISQFASDDAVNDSRKTSDTVARVSQGSSDRTVGNDFSGVVEDDDEVEATSECEDAEAIAFRQLQTLIATLMEENRVLKAQLSQRDMMAEIISEHRTTATPKSATMGQGSRIEERTLSAFLDVVAPIEGARLDDEIVDLMALNPELGDKKRLRDALRLPGSNMIKVYYLFLQKHKRLFGSLEDIKAHVAREQLKHLLAQPLSLSVSSGRPSNEHEKRVLPDTLKQKLGKIKATISKGFRQVFNRKSRKPTSSPSVSPIGTLGLVIEPIHSE